MPRCSATREILYIQWHSLVQNAQELMMEEITSTHSSSSSLDGWRMSLALASAFFSWILIHRWMQRKTSDPKTWPILGSSIEQLINFQKIHDWITSYLARARTVTVVMPSRRYTYTADPANVEYILKTNFSNYPKGKGYYSIMQVLLGDGIFNADGEAWRRQRKTASLEFASRNLRDFSTIVFRDYAVKLSAILSRASDQKQQVELQDLFMRMTLDSICKVGFGVEIGTLSPELPENSFAQAFDAANAAVPLRFINPLWKLKRFLCIGSEAVLARGIQSIDEFTHSLIQKRKAEINAGKSASREAGDEKVVIKKHDILSRFIELSDNPDSNLTDKSLRDVVLNFVIAGRDTTAATLTWFVYMMVKHPAVAERLCSELRSFEEERAMEEKISLVTADPEDPDDESFPQRVSQFAKLLSYDSLGRLSYLHAAITETLRLYPAVPLDPKGVLEDDVLPDGTRVKAGDFVAYVPYSMGRMEYLWGPNAASFDPDRWFKDGVFLSHISPFKFTAFQAGPRICLGKDSAYLQMKITLAILCRFFVFKLVPEHPVRYRAAVILVMAHGLKLTLSKRRPGPDNV